MNRSQIFFPIFTRAPRHRLRYAFDLRRDVWRANVNSDESNPLAIRSRGHPRRRHSPFLIRLFAFFPLRGHSRRLALRQFTPTESRTETRLSPRHSHAPDIYTGVGCTSLPSRGGSDGGRIQRKRRLLPALHPHNRTRLRRHWSDPRPSQTDTRRRAGRGSLFMRTPRPVPPFCAECPRARLASHWVPASPNCRTGRCRGRRPFRGGIHCGRNLRYSRYLRTHTRAFRGLFFTLTPPPIWATTTLALDTCFPIRSGLPKAAYPGPDMRLQSRGELPGSQHPLTIPEVF